MVNRNRGGMGPRQQNGGRERFSDQERFGEAGAGRERFEDDREFDDDSYRPADEGADFSSREVYGEGREQQAFRHRRTGSGGYGEYLRESAQQSTFGRRGARGGNRESDRFDEGDYERDTSRSPHRERFGAEESTAGQRGRYSSGMHAGKGPKGYRRSDERIMEEINDSLTAHGEIDPSDVEVKVENGEVTLSGTVDSRQAKRLAEDLAENVAGVQEVINQIRIHRSPSGGEATTSAQTQGENAGKSAKSHR